MVDYKCILYHLYTLSLQQSTIQIITVIVNFTHAILSVCVLSLEARGQHCILSLLFYTPFFETKSSLKTETHQCLNWMANKP